MMLWDIIRDWYVQYIFGGCRSDGSMFTGVLSSDIDLDSSVFPLVGNNVVISMADWLSTTATVITLVLLVIMLLSLVRFIIRQVCGLFAKI